MNFLRPYFLEIGRRRSAKHFAEISPYCSPISANISQELRAGALRAQTLGAMASLDTHTQSDLRQVLLYLHEARIQDFQDQMGNPSRGN